MCEIDSEGCVIVKKPWVTKGFCCNKLAKCSVFHNDECMMSIKFNASKNLTFYILLTVLLMLLANLSIYNKIKFAFPQY